jgi:endogenous inhibitor of DNA gyrase (YacG/DUF329 family)
VKKGVRIWTCDGCGKRETWRKGWFYLPCVESPSNVGEKAAGLFYQAAFCSGRCEDVGLARMLAS